MRLIVIQQRQLDYQLIWHPGIILEHLMYWDFFQAKYALLTPKQWRQVLKKLAL